MHLKETTISIDKDTYMNNEDYTRQHGNPGFDDDEANQSIFNLVEVYISDSQRF